MMKRIFYSLVILALGVAVGSIYGPMKEKFRQDRKEDHHRIARKTHPVLGEKPFVIITMSYNNEAFVEKNLLSTLQQDYSNYRIIYINDASTDGTAAKVQKILTNFDPENRVTFVDNPANYGAMENLYHAVHSCKSDEIVAIVDGDDFLAHDGVLKSLNAYYANSDVWMTYGNFAEYPSYAEGNVRKFGESRPINLKIQKERGVRKQSFVSSHLRTFYAGLFQRIKIEHFLKDGKFLPIACDVASMLPMLELAEEHAYFIPEILYLYNVGNPNCDFKKDLSGQQQVEQEIRRLPAYTSLREHPRRSFIDQEEHVDLVVFSYDRPLQLYAFLESAEKYLSHLHQCHIIYRASNDHYAKGYAKVFEKYPHVRFYKQSSQPNDDFAPLIRKVVFDPAVANVRYVIFAVDDIVIKDEINFKEAVRHLKQTGAYGLYFRLGRRTDYCYMQDFDQGIPESIQLDQGLYAWQFSSGKGDWRYPNTLDMALYRKEEIRPYFVCLKFHNPNSLEALWDQHAELKKVGLYYEDSKIVNLPLNIVMENEWVNEKISDISTKDLLNLFEQGLKMDIQPLHQIDNNSVHIDYQPEFIKR